MSSRGGILWGGGRGPANAAQFMDIFGSWIFVVPERSGHVEDIFTWKSGEDFCTRRR